MPTFCSKSVNHCIPYVKLTFSTCHALHFAPHSLTLWCKFASRAALAANSSTLGANPALAEMLAEPQRGACIGPTAHVMPPNFQKSLDFCCSSVFNPVRCVSRCISCSSNGSSASPVVLKPCIHPYIHAYTRLCIAICIQRLGLHYVMGGGWELSIQMSM